MPNHPNHALHGGCFTYGVPQCWAHDARSELSDYQACTPSPAQEWHVQKPGRDTETAAQSAHIGGFRRCFQRSSLKHV